MKQSLEANGWIIYYECSCGGGKQYYSNKEKKGYEIRVRQKGQTFSIIQNNQIIAGPFWGYQLEEKLKLYGL